MKNRKYRYLTIATWLLILLVWFAFTKSGLVATTKLPSPLDVLRAGRDIIENGYNYLPLWKHIAISMYRLLIAVLAGLIFAVPLGLLCGYNPKINAVISSLINFYRPLPPLAYYTLLIVWLGIGETSKIMLLFLACFAPVFISASSAVSRVNHNFVLSAKTLGASKKQIFFAVIFPAALPEIFAGIRTAVSVAYTTLVSAEMVAAAAGLGWLVLDAYKYLKTDVVFVGIILMGLTGIMLDYILRLIEKKWIFWNGK